MLKRVLMLSASSGAGHVRAADAVERALRATGASGDVRHVAALRYTTKLFQRLYAQAYLDTANHAPEVLGWIYDHLDRPWKHEGLRLALDKLNMQPFVKLLESYRPESTPPGPFPPPCLGGRDVRPERARPKAAAQTDTGGSAAPPLRSLPCPSPSIDTR